jgi:holo-[acyl-carrier protein] synthase
MIVAMGIDAVEIDRFAAWHTKSRTSLQRIFSDEEIDYCLKNRASSAERFAVRFAAKEACLKALSTLSPASTISLLRVCKAAIVKKHPNGVPYIAIAWELLPDISPVLQHYRWHLSLTHTKQTAMALLVVEKGEIF